MLAVAQLLATGLASVVMVTGTKLRWAQTKNIHLFSVLVTGTNGEKRALIGC